MVKCRNLIIGEGMPKICVPVTIKNDEDILNQLPHDLPYDFIELRIDTYSYLNECHKVITLLQKIRELVECPILLTCRSLSEGGQSSLTKDEYKQLLIQIIESGLTDMVDVEVNVGNAIVFEVVEKAKSHNIKVVMSYHNFDKTPSQEDMMDILEKMEVMGGDILKIAVMPVCKKDVVTLMNTSLIMSSRIDKPLIMISMGELGKITRIAGELIGSSVTFGMAIDSSAPGQIHVSHLKVILESIHK